MKKFNEKCSACLYRENKSILLSKTLTDNKTSGDLVRPLNEVTVTKENYFCSHKQINLNNIIVKNCSSFTNGKQREEDSQDEFSPEEVFKSLPQQKRINFTQFFK